MSREIKFRALCITHSKWEYYSLGDLICGSTLTDAGEGEFNGNSWGQYTGLKDKNGVEIYEGDIVRDEYPRLYEVIFNDRNASFCLKGYHYNSYFDDDVMVDELEVIGNIHQNADLLK